MMTPTYLRVIHPDERRFIAEGYATSGRMEVAYLPEAWLHLR